MNEKVSLICNEKTKQGYWRKGDSPSDLDLKVFDFFERVGVSSGFYVECGACNGIAQSNTLLLEQKGWTGLLIEADPRLSQECKWWRPQNIVYHAALVGPDYNSSTIRGVFSTRVGISPSVVDDPSAIATDFGITVPYAMAVEEAWDPRSHTLGQPYPLKIKNFLVERYEAMLTGLVSEDEGALMKAAALPARQNVEVPACTLFHVLQTCDIKASSIDFFSLDVEGLEVEVLNGLNLDYYRPRYILVETISPEIKQEIDSLMIGKNYKEVVNFDNHDIMYEAQ